MFTRYRRLLAARAASPAFHPQGAQAVIDLSTGVFGLLRRAAGSGAAVLALQNVTARPQAVALDQLAWPPTTPSHSQLTDLITGRRFDVQPASPLFLQPYETLWLEPVHV